MSPIVYTASDHYAHSDADQALVLAWIRDHGVDPDWCMGLAMASDFQPVVRFTCLQLGEDGRPRLNESRDEFVLDFIMIAQVRPWPLAD